ncbi:MAG: Substrate-specific component RibU of riboflavin transporter [Oscillospiraceae bacterium]|jgi:riboflavin transporter FmnP|nr:Substrate-specific component RibU of riboflavin transporter [Oscillospiraceae bacterium]
MNTNTRKMVTLAMLSAVSVVLMFISFNVPLMPSFIKMDFSELPALIAAFSMGPLSGAVVCFIKNAVNVFFTTTGGIGELCNFLLGVCFVVPAGLIYKRFKGRKGALIGSLTGAISMAVLSVFLNYYIVYPIYTLFMPMEAIIGMYQAINHRVSNLWEALLTFNLPFTFVKGLCSVIITFLIYKKISPLIKSRPKRVL